MYSTTTTKRRKKEETKKKKRKKEKEKERNRQKKKEERKRRERREQEKRVWCGGLAVVLVEERRDGQLNGPAFATGLFWESGSAHYTGRTQRYAMVLTLTLPERPFGWPVPYSPMQMHWFWLLFTGMYTVQVLYSTLSLQDAQATSPDGGWCEFPE